ncbi:MAG TPA: DUF4242 domain-containing protein [Candidatus Dormibacteraeota bacterium]|nr:DUF4242 domain-containing protein [Candidatus Dormibacteraeota bacterium]
MPKYVIERDLPGAGQLTAEQLRGISEKSNQVLKDLDGIQWQHSYVAGDKIYCVYFADNEDLIREHGRCGGFPVTTVTEVSAVIDPATGGA